MSETTAFTREQASLLDAAKSGGVLLTPPGSVNDIRWGELADAGWMEPADLPQDLSAIFHGWRLTKEGRAVLAPREEPTR